MFDYIKESKEIATLLEKQGLHEDAKLISEAIAYGFSGNEIAMATRHNMRGISKKNSIVPEEIREKMRVVISYLDEVLG